MPDTDHRIRMAAFTWLRHQVDLHGDVLPWSLLSEGFQFEGRRVPLLSQQGIFKPKLCRLPLSIRTSIKGPYDDRAASEEGLMLYRYMGEDPDHWQNVGLRTAMKERMPLIYFYGVVEGRYLVAWPVYVVGDDPGALTFTVAVDDAATAARSPAGEPAEAEWAEPEATARRVYVTGTFRRRLHQRSFRERVLRAYRGRCALCRLHHAELLDAAHIVPDAEAGSPEVSNGLALCKIHHAAFDRHFIGVRPDLVVEVRDDLLEEHDGPMLEHGLQKLHGTRIADNLPRRRPDRPSMESLEWRYERFRAAG